MSAKRTASVLARYVLVALLVCISYPTPTYAINVQFQEQEKLQKSIQLLSKAQYDNAIALLSNLSKRYPANAEIYYWLGIAHARKNDFITAYQHLEQSLRIAPDNIKLSVEYGKVLLKGGRVNDAEKVFENALAKTANKTERLEIKRLLTLVHGQRLIDQKNWEQAVLFFEQALQQFPRDTALLTTLAAIYSSLELWEEAERLYRYLGAQDPQSAQGLLQIADLYEKKQDFESMRRLLRELLRSNTRAEDKERAETKLLASANSLTKKSEIAESIANLKTVVEFNPTHLSAHIALFQLLMLSNKVQDALDSLSPLDPKNIDSIELRVLTAKAYARLNRLNEAIIQYEWMLANVKKIDVRREAAANLKILYNYKADEIIAAATSAKSEDEKNIDAITETARQWIEKNHLDPAKTLLDYALAQDASNAKAHYWSGALHDRKRQFGPAMYHIKRSIELSPRNPVLFAALARTQARAELFDEAEKTYRHILSQTTETALANENEYLLNFVIGQKFTQQKDYARAIKHFETMLTKKSDDVAVLARLAYIYGEIREFSKAETILLGMLDNDKNNTAIMLQLATIYEKAGDSNKRDELLKKAILLDPYGGGASQATYRLGLREGNNSLAEKRWDDAIGWFERVLDVDANNVQALVGIGKANIGLNDMENAEKSLKLALTIDPGNLDSRLQLARMAVTQDRLAEAIVDLSRVVAADKSGALGQEALINLINIYKERAIRMLNSGYIAEAERDYKAIIRLNKNDIEAHAQLGYLYFIFGRERADAKMLRLSLHEYNTVLSLDPSNTEAHITKATIFELAGDTPAALSSYVDALAHNRDETIEARLINDVKMQVVRIAYAEGDQAFAIKELLDMQVREPGKDRYYVFLGTIYSMQGKYDEAVAQWQNAIELNPNDTYTRFRLAGLYERTNEDLLAAAQYRTILQQNETSRITEAARQLLPLAEERARLVTGQLQYSLVRGKSRIGNAAYLDTFTSMLRADLSGRWRSSKYNLVTLNYSPTYSTFHDQENDNIATTLSISSNANHDKYYYSTNLNYRETSGLLTETYRGYETGGSATVGIRIDDTASLQETENVAPTYAQFQILMRDVHSSPSDVTYYDVVPIATSVQIISPLFVSGSWSVGHRITLMLNRHRHSRDYANGSYRGSMDFSVPLIRKLSANFGASLEYQQYIFNDSRVLIEQTPQQRRRIATASVYTGLLYRLHPRVTLSADISLLESRSSLESGFINVKMNNEIQTIGLQSASLSDNRNISATATLMARF